MRRTSAPAPPAVRRLLTPFQALDGRLDAQSRAPLAVAFSGGGDSLALLLMTKTWADRAGRSVLALTVDHGLQPQSAAWTQEAAAAAHRIGVGFRALSWDGPKPDKGLPAAARAARHSLIADAARAAGSSVILMGHTLDDQLENALMRASGEGVGVLRDWSPSPVWPRGRGVFLCRPLLAVRRADLRRWLGDQGQSWIDDPANEDVRSPRVRARSRLGQGEGADWRAEPNADDALRGLASACRTTKWGGIFAPRDVLVGDAVGARRLLQIAAACAAGRQALGRPERAGAVLERLKGGEAFVACLGGARLTAGRDLLITREAGEFRRTGSDPVRLEMARPTVWDGRFELTAWRAGLAAAPLKGRMALLEPTEKARLLALPADARGALPAILQTGRRPACPILAGKGVNAPEVTAFDLVEHRFRAACGLITRERESSAFGEMANCSHSSYVGAEAKGLFE